MTPARFHLTLLIGRRLYWEADAEGLMEVPDAAEAAHGLLCFDTHDHRQACRRARSARAGAQAFMREWGEAVHVLDLSRELGAQYGRDLRHGPAAPAAGLLSGLQLLDRLARRAGVTQDNRVLGLRLGAVGQHGRSLVLLFAYDGAGELLRFQEAANPPSLAYLLEDFCRGCAVQATVEDVIWFDHRDVLAVLPQMRPYPIEESLLGHPVRVWWQNAARALVGTAAMVTLVLAGLTADLWWAGHQLARIRAAEDVSQLHVQQLLGGAAGVVARAASAPTNLLFGDAEALWLPGTRVRVAARPGEALYTLLVETDGSDGRSGTADGQPTVAGRALADRLAAVGRHPPPAGLQALDPASSGDLHALYLRFRRSTPVPDFVALAAAGS